MFYVARQILHNQQDAEDAVHQAFVSIIENLEKIVQIDCPKTRSYIVIITERKAIDLARGRDKVVPLEPAEKESGIDFPLPGDGGLADAMARLPARYREILLLHYDSGYSAEELARMLQMRRATVQKLLWRAKTALQAILDREGIAH